ncbi:MAG: hypothetical protein PHC61_03930 [Chitinivibrionales bacterium]|nr:hypothetical protein [Chitinivibrionales bacterium]
MARTNSSENIEKIEASLKKYFNETGVSDATINITPSGYSDNIHVILVSDTFAGKEQTKREEPIFRYLKDNVGDFVLVKITLLLTMTYDEYSRYSTPGAINTSGIIGLSATNEN